MSLLISSWIKVRHCYVNKTNHWTLAVWLKKSTLPHFVVKNVLKSTSEEVEIIRIQNLYNKICFRADVHNINLRLRGLLTIAQHNAVFYQRSFSYNIAKVYHDIPESVKTLTIKTRSFLCYLQLNIDMSNSAVLYHYWPLVFTLKNFFVSFYILY